MNSEMLLQVGGPCLLSQMSVAAVTVCCHCEQFMEKFNELKDLVNASITSAAAMATDKQSNDVDITVKPEFTQQQSVCHIASLLLISIASVLEPIQGSPRSPNPRLH